MTDPQVQKFDGSPAAPGNPAQGGYCSVGVPPPYGTVPVGFASPGPNSFGQPLMQPAVNPNYTGVRPRRVVMESPIAHLSATPPGVDNKCVTTSGAPMTSSSQVCQKPPSQLSQTGQEAQSNHSSNSNDDSDDSRPGGTTSQQESEEPLQLHEGTMTSDQPKNNAMTTGEQAEQDKQGE